MVTATKKIKQFDAVKVEWLDAFSEDGWKDISLLQAKEKTALCTTIGFLVLETEDYYHIAGTLSVTEVACTMAVPKGMVVSIKKLSVF